MLKQIYIKTEDLSEDLNTQHESILLKEEISNQTMKEGPFKIVSLKDFLDDKESETKERHLLERDSYSNNTQTLNFSQCEAHEEILPLLPKCETTITVNEESKVINLPADEKDDPLGVSKHEKKTQDSSNSDSEKLEENLTRSRSPSLNKSKGPTDLSPKSAAALSSFEYISCHICNQEISTTEYKDHLSIHGLNPREIHSKVDPDNSKKVLQCYFCAKSFPDHEKLKQHLPVHEYEKTFKCHICDGKFITKRSLQHHIFSTHKEKNFACWVCSKKFVLEKSLIKHSVIHSEEAFECIICSKTFADAAALQKHSILHDEGKCFECQFCSKTFLLEYNYEKHLLTHKNDGKCECPKCLKKFLDPKTLQAHMRIHTAHLECPICLKKFYRPIGLKYHSFVHTGEKPFGCNKCNKYFRHPASLRRHACLTIPNADKIECDICSKTFFSKHGMRKHMLCHIDEKLYECPKCYKKFACQTYLNTHMKGHTDQFKCQICHKRFTKLVILKKHVLRHYNRLKFECTDCFESFPKKSLLKKHTTVHKVKLTQRQLKCFKCKRRFSYQKSLDEHLLIHQLDEKNDMQCQQIFEPQCILTSDENMPSVVENALSENIKMESTELLPETNLDELWPRTRPDSENVYVLDDCPSDQIKELPYFKCELCNKLFPSLKRLKKHNYTHKKDLTVYTCEICHKKFKGIRALRDHSIFHDESRLVSCSFCEKKFSRRADLEKHERIHTGIKPFECNFCYKKFKQLGHLNTHLLIHSDTKDYQCQHCNKRFRYKGSLKNHLGAIHTSELCFECDQCNMKFKLMRYLRRHKQIHLKMNKAVPYQESNQAALPSLSHTTTYPE